MSSGTYFPPPVKAVEIPKRIGEGSEFSEYLPWRTGSRRPWWRMCWSGGGADIPPGFLRVPARGGRHWTRWRNAGNGAGGTTGERRDKPAWRRDMRTSCIEGVAIHGDLGSCVGVREDAGEALTEGDVGWVIEPRNHQSGVPTPSQWPEGNIAGRASASCQRTPRGQRACACVESSGARTGRSRGCPSGCDGRAGRSGNAEAVSPR